VGGENCYITTGTSNPSSVILLLPDVFGIYANSKAYADRLNDVTGCTVVVADLFGGEGKGFPSSMMLLMGRLHAKEGWFENRSFFSGLWLLISTIGGLIMHLPLVLVFLLKNGKFEKKFPLIDALLAGLVAERGMKQFVCAGYCYGAPLATHLGASSKWQGICKGISPTHGTIPMDDIAQLKVPGHFACSEHDMMFKDAQREHLITVLKNHPNDEARKSDVKLYPAHHGFAMRADPLVTGDLERTVEECFQDLVAFTKRVLLLK